ncbi:uncharacterized protein N7483_013042 [Penicillium malachiteum]|uniref:uncharacterized protein n=1 Tax=Penicillium malachiteum TaxID=1324776 RepID=UPI002546A190|nr:uncharacterized protein N7483_013042 [Penicillium malachiteum]KAJ5715861.1 hypothetical protein N7483_013042 [Penicillium malachiteum]
MNHGETHSGELNEANGSAPVPEGSGPLELVRNGPLPKTQWKQSSRIFEENLAQGISNEDVWMLLRRFNKQIYHVRAVKDEKGQSLDLNRVDNERFPPEKLRITVERFYTSVIVGVIEFFRHVTRLRSWKETGRTSIFCSVYFVSWASDLLLPTILSTIAALILFPPLRLIMFPIGAPPTVSDGSSENNTTKNQPESLDSLTGVPENHKGEAAEQEAKNLIDSIAVVAMESAAAKYGQTTVEGASDQHLIGNGSEILEETPDTPPGDVPEDKTKKPIKAKISHGTDKTMRVLSDITDVYERFANSLSPTPPFFLITSRLQLAGILTIVSAIFPFVSSYWIIKGIGFAIGGGFFGDPVIKYALDVLDQKIPNWKSNLDLQKTLLAGVPTNAQLTLTLLRIGEINSEPLPPPPVPGHNDRAWPIQRKKSQGPSMELSKQKSENNLIRSNSEGSLEPKPKRRTMLKILKFIRRTIATAIKGHIAFDRAIAIAGAAHTKNLIGMLQRGHFSATPFGPLKFDAKFERKRGAAVIDTSKQPPVLYFTTYQSAGLDDLRIESRKQSSILFQIPVTEIKELKKTEGLGWKRKLIVELTAGSKEAADGLVVIGDDLGQSYHLTGMRSRNQLFNRLVAIDAQFWESR